MNKQQASPKKSALTTALDCISRRHMSAFQLSSKLEMKGFSSGEITEAMNKLIAWRYIDDQGYALSYIKSKEKKYSRARIVGELHRAGIDAAIINRAMEDCYPDQKEFANGLSIGRRIYTSEYTKMMNKVTHTPSETGKKYPGTAIPPDILLRKKVGDKLLAKGYRLETVKKILVTILQEENDDKNV